MCTRSFDAFLRNVSVTKTLRSNSIVEFSYTIKTEVLTEEPLYDDIIEAKKV